MALDIICIDDIDDNEDIEFLEPEFDNDNYQLLATSNFSNTLNEPEIQNSNDDNAEVAVASQETFEDSLHLSQHEDTIHVPKSALQINGTPAGQKTPRAAPKPRRTSRFATKVCMSFCLNYLKLHFYLFYIIRSRQSKMSILCKLRSYRKPPIKSFSKCKICKHEPSSKMILLLTKMILLLIKMKK